MRPFQSRTANLMVEYLQLARRVEAVREGERVFAPGIERFSPVL